MSHRFQRTAALLLEKRRVFRSEIALINARPEQPCDGCTACCTVMGIQELDKDPYNHCPHEIREGSGFGSNSPKETGCAAGCAIYPKRPQSCKDFACMYRIGDLVGGTAIRPDNLGVIFQCRPPGPATCGYPFILAHEVWPGAFKSDLARTAIANLADQELLILVYETTRTLLGPPQRVAQVQARLRQEGLL